jgi:hypothetical protein
VPKAHRLLYHSSLGSREIKKKSRAVPRGCGSGNLIPAARDQNKSLVSGGTYRAAHRHLFVIVPVRGRLPRNPAADTRLSRHA